jgi:hypothetical protein
MATHPRKIINFLHLQIYSFLIHIGLSAVTKERARHGTCSLNGGRMVYSIEYLGKNNMDGGHIKV